MDKELLNRLSDLQPSAVPLWGVMTAQHMVEHLADSLKMSTGRPEIILYSTPEQAGRMKMIIIYSDRQLSKGIKNPAMPENPLPLRHVSMSDALQELAGEWNNFNDHYLRDLFAKHTHPRFGKLDHKEWMIFHQKHFLHHLAQFGLA
jgi:hypothetical protein